MVVKKLKAMDKLNNMRNNVNLNYFIVLIQVVLCGLFERIFRIIKINNVVMHYKFVNFVVKMF